MKISHRSISVKVCSLCMLMICSWLGAFSQSPFNYGHRKRICFVSAAQRDSLGMKSITSISRDGRPEPGGQYRWDVVIIDFDPETISCGWHPVWKDKDYVFNFDSLISEAVFLNGTQYHFRDKELEEYGGTGYGSFDWGRITRFEQVSYVETSCVGHCGEEPSRYSKNVLDDRGRVLYRVFYPLPKSLEADEDDYPDKSTPGGYEALVTSGISRENRPDTLFYKYDHKGLFLGDSKKSVSSIKELYKLFSGPSAFSPHEIQRCYAGSIPMEEFMKAKLGYVPELLLVEIYPQGVFSFLLNKKDRKYYFRQERMLE
jgi:hypothetical protein